MTAEVGDIGGSRTRLLRIARSIIIAVSTCPAPESPMDRSVNVFGEPLEDCNQDPVTGFFRDGCCNTSDQDLGSHTVCVRVTKEFLEFSASRGNDLSTPHPEFEFPGLKPGDLWCLCAARWAEAYQHGMAPRVMLKSTHARALEVVPLSVLRQYAADLN